MEKNEKTNVMRLLDQAGISYRSRHIESKEALSGVEMAQKLGENPEHVFKTLVTEAPGKKHFVFVIPVAENLNLKKAANAACEKSITMIPQKELLPLTGYVHGGCSPIGMKKYFDTFIDETAELFDTIMFSAGKIGYQVEIPLSDLLKMIPARTADLTM